MKKIVIFMLALLLAFSQQGSLMAESNIQMGQRNSADAEWDSVYPITKSENVLMKNGESLDLALLDSNTAVNPALLIGLTDSDLIDSAIELAIADNRIVTIPPKSPINGDVWLLDRAIEVPTDFTLILNNCYIKLKPGVNDNIIRTKNVRDLSLAQNINIVGLGSATLDGNGVLQTTGYESYKRIGVLFFNVNGFKVSGFKVKNTHGWGMSFESGCVYGKISNIDIDQDGLVVNQDGIDIRDGCHHIDIDNITGTADDDGIALTALSNNVMQVVNDGSKGVDIHDINISNVHMESRYCNIIDLICNDGKKTYNININNVYDTSEKFRTRSTVGAVINIGNCDFAPFALVRPAIDGELHNIKIDSVSGRGMYLIKFGWFSNNVHLSNLTMRDDFDYVFRSYNARHMPFVVRDIFIDGVYANQPQTDSNGTTLTPANWRGTIFDFLDGDIQNFNAKNVNIGSCKNVIVLNPTATMSKYCDFGDFSISTTSHQVYSIKNDNAKLALDNWSVLERNDIFISDTTKLGQFYPIKEYPNSTIKIGEGMPDFLPVDVKTNTVHSIEANTTYYVDAINGTDINDGLTSNKAVKTIQKAINILPKTINGVVTISIAEGTYLEDVELTGFNGSKYIVINGASSLSNTRQVSSFILTNNTCYISLNGLNITKTTALCINATRCLGLDINYCKITTASGLAGIFYSSSFGSVWMSDISNRQSAIVSSMFSGINSKNNVGVGNTYGLISTIGGTIVKNGTQPIGISNEYTDLGGVIK